MTVGIAILGSTGSIGRSTLQVLARQRERFRVVALTAHSNAELLERQAAEWRPAYVGLVNGGGGMGSGTECLVEAATHPDVRIVVNGIVGAAGLEATLGALRAGKRVALANKETLVMAGALMTRAAREHGVRLLPVDSEHSAIFQCLVGASPREVRRLVLTASGGPFRGWSRAALEGVTVAQALRHPTWRMGAKITIDSATLMNKGLEVLEAHWLFGVPFERIDVVVHPQSIVHSMVEFVDRSVLAQLSMPDMGIPILYALTHPDRLPCPAPALDLVQLGSLTFEAPDEAAFPCLALARRAGRAGGAAPLVLNAANEVAVAGFLDGRCGFMDIPRLIGDALDTHAGAAAADLGACLDLDGTVRRWTEGALGGIPAGSVRG
jgi:1-deoxy-D-xylulose-5-phosphate reductoisomerase